VKNEALATVAISKLRTQADPRPVLVIAHTDVLNLGDPTATGPARGLSC